MKKLSKLMHFQILLFATVIPTMSGGLYIPENFSKAYEKGTRAETGEPGPKYWQNGADYLIDVALDPETGHLTGSEKIVYYNNSPDSLDSLVIHVFANLFKKGTAREVEITPSDESSGVLIKKLIFNGKEIEISGDAQQIIYIHNDFKLILPEAIKSGATAQLEMEWEYTINLGLPVRTGRIDERSFFVAYFFPRIAVYDDIDGWNEYKYAGRSEFYNDFGDFEVSISVPDKYLVWATGNLQNPEQVLVPEYAARLNQAMQSDKVVNIITAHDLDQRITASGSENVWKFKAENVNDFAFATSDHYLWDGSSLVVDESTGQRVFIDAAYNPESRDFYSVAQIARDAIHFMSTEIPGVPFPYPCETVFNGNEEMEYPMMVNDMSVQDTSYLIKLTSHEISHSYFPFYMGINETKYAWMDEGWASFIDYQICRQLDPAGHAYFFYTEDYRGDIGTDRDMPMIANSVLLKKPAYHYNSYVKPASFLFILRDVLGEAKFRKITQDYMKMWQGKHPMPYDYFYSMEKGSDQDLTWLVRPWFFEFGQVDLAITDVKTGSDGYSIHISRIGSYPAPFQIEIEYVDHQVEVIKKNTIVWSNGNIHLVEKLPASKKIGTIKLNLDPVLDADPDNNIYHINDQ